MITYRLPLVTALAAVCGLVSAADVPVQRVKLFSSGVGYFEHSGTVDGNASTELRFKTAQINDILKSLVVEDRNGGTISTVAYPSQDPLAKTLKSFQLDLSGAPSLGGLLAQLRGAQVSVTTADQELDGIILGVETQRRIVGERGDAIDTVVLNLLSGATVRAIPMDSVRNLELTDPALRVEVEKALAAIAQARDQDSKPVSISFQGQGQRQVRLGYVIETPVWKTSYRLILSDDPAGSRLQGWAIVENQTDSDWNDVELTLVSGRPISFIQDLYKPLYIQRPVFVPDLFASLGPVAYTDGLRDTRGGFAEKASGGEADGKRQGLSFRAPSAASATMAAQEADAWNGPMDPTASVKSMANTEKLGAFFHYSVKDVDLSRQRSAMLPIVTDAIQTERVSIYNQSVQAQHPLLGARVTNTTGKHLSAGPITVFDGGGYTGDARIEDLPPKQDRLLSFAVDLEIRVISEGRSQSNTTLGGKLVKGVLYLQQRQVATQEYAISNKADKDRALIIEHPLHPGWDLVDTPKPTETTETLHRFRQTVAAGASSTLKVTEAYVQWESFAIIDWDTAGLLSYQRNGAIPAKVRDALAKVATLKQDLVDRERTIQERELEVNTITTEQNRIRSNMQTVQQNTAYYQRLLAKLNDQETRLDQLRQEIETARTDMTTKQREFEAFLGGLTIE